MLVPDPTGLLVGDAAPDVDFDLPVDVQRERRTEFVELGEVPLEGVGDRTEPVCHRAVDLRHSQDGSHLPVA